LRIRRERKEGEGRRKHEKIETKKYKRYKKDES
jgi:hypothetical protein